LRTEYRRRRSGSSPSELLVNLSRDVLDYLAYCSYNVCQDELIRDLAKEIKIKCRLSSRDALHIASACNAKVDYFLTCDDELVKKADHICEILETKGYHLNIANPIDLVGMIRSE